MRRIVLKSAVDGKFVSKQEAARNPKETYRQTVKPKPKPSKKGK